MADAEINAAVASDTFDVKYFAEPSTPATPTWSSAEPRRLVRAQRAGVLAVFEDRAVALDAGRRLQAVLVAAAAEPGGGTDIEEHAVGTPSPPEATAPEVALMAELGLPTPTRGFGWLGTDRSSGPAVSVMGQVVTVADLVFVDADPDEPNPIHDALRALGATRTVGELDWAYDLGAAVDLACLAPDPVPAVELLDVADYLAASWRYDVTAPWDGPIVERAASLRRSYRQLQERQRTVSRSMFDDPVRIARQVDDAVQRGEDPIAAVRDALGVEGSVDPGIVDGIDPVVVGWFLEDQLPVEVTDEERLRAERRSARSAALGAPDVEPGRAGARSVLGMGGLSGEWQIDLSTRPASVRVVYFQSNSLARTLPRMVDHLVGIGCTDVAIEVIDRDLE